MNVRCNIYSPLFTCRKNYRIPLSKMIVFFILALIISISTNAAKVLPKNSRASYFGDHRNSKRLNGHVIATLQVNSVTRCSIACNKDPTCLSFNLCNQVSCYLNSEDVFSTADSENILQDDNSCQYFGMSRHSKVICTINGVHQDLHDDADPLGNIC